MLPECIVILALASGLLGHFGNALAHWGCFGALARCVPHAAWLDRLQSYNLWVSCLVAQVLAEELKRGCCDQICTGGLDCAGQSFANEMVQGHMISLIFDARQIWVPWFCTSPRYVPLPRV